MPGSTALGIRYPLLSEPPVVHTDMQRLAGDVDTLLAQGFAGTPYAMATGTVTTASIAAGGTLNQAITFPAGRFSVAPFVFAQHVAGPNQPYAIRTSSITASGANLAIGIAATSSAGAATVQWVAIQMTASAAAG
jgi:hypothetical protein